MQTNFFENPSRLHIFLQNTTSLKFRFYSNEIKETNAT